jgi:cytochrome d ubiquinol oxidase subunit II
MTGSVESLNTVWFCLIGVLWAGYFFLEGFDFGVGILMPFVSRDDVDRRLCFNAIGPFWDGNEVWLIVAGGATFAAFPTWYAIMFSGFYLALFLILAALIIRGVAFEFRAKRQSETWKRTWDTALFLGSLIPSILWGVAFTDLIVGLDIGKGPLYYGGFGGLVPPIAILGGVLSLAVFISHGASFLSLKTTSDLSERARRVGKVSSLVAVVFAAGLVAWIGDSIAGSLRPEALPGAVPVALAVLGMVALLGGSGLLSAGRSGASFLSGSVAILALSAAAFSALFPRVMVSSKGVSYSLTIWNAASAHETLLVMTVVAGIFTPFVLAYQGWTYWVFRQRLRRPPASLPSPNPRPQAGLSPSGTGSLSASTQTSEAGTPVG